ncbi:uncharacterized protein LOC110482171 [Lonchura striata]
MLGVGEVQRGRPSSPMDSPLHLCGCETRMLRVKHFFTGWEIKAEPVSCTARWHLLFLSDLNHFFGLTDQICHQLCHFPTKTGRKHTKTEKEIITARSIFCLDN